MKDSVNVVNLTDIAGKRVLDDSNGGVSRESAIQRGDEDRNRGGEAERRIGRIATGDCGVRRNNTI